MQNVNINPDAMDIEQKLFTLAIWIWVWDTVSDTTWNSKRNKHRVFLRLKSAFILIIKAHLSVDSNNTLCPRVQYVNTTSTLHTLKVLVTNIAIWPSASTTKDNRLLSIE